jgi:cell division cycle 20, cofactor of APC complex
MGLADERILNFSDISSSLAAPKIHSLLRISASQLFRSPVQTQTISATSNIGRRADLILDGPNITPDPFAYPLSWSTKNYIAVAFGPTVYYQNLDTRVTKRLWSINEDRWEEIHALQWGGSATPHTLALGTTLGRVSLCDAKNDVQTMTWPKDSLGSVGGIDWADHIFAVGRRSGKISLFDSRVKEGVRTLVGHKAKVFGVRWSHDGRYLASGDQDGAVYIWDARAGKFLVGRGEKGRKMQHTGPVKVCHNPLVLPWQLLIYNI